MTTCNHCNTETDEGYLNEETGEVYCSATCLDFTSPGLSKQIAELDEDELDESHIFWTTFDNEEYVDICNNEECQNIHEDMHTHCDICGCTTRQVSKGDIGL